MRRADGCVSHCVHQAAVNTTRNRYKMKRFRNRNRQNGSLAGKTSGRFVRHIHTGIELLDKSPANLADEEVIHLFVRNGMPYGNAVEILLFLPIAFVRCWLPHLRWPESYTKSFDNGMVYTKRFDETESFLSIMGVTRSYFRTNPQKETVLKIAGRSEEFGVMNQLLLDNPQAKLEEVVFSETVITACMTGKH